MVFYLYKIFILVLLTYAILIAILLFILQTTLHPFRFEANKTKKINDFKEYYDPTVNRVDRSSIYQPLDSPKLILLWNTDASFKGFRKVLHLSNCKLTENKKLLPKASAVILWGGPWNCKSTCVPRVRYPYQLYVLAHMEPECYSKDDRWIKSFPPDYFNLSMNFRMDSHLPTPYMTMKKTHSQADITTEDIYKKSKLKLEKKLVAWFVSSCHTYNKRHLYVQELSKYIQVDIYGNCGPLKNRGRMNADDYNDLEKKYKFYLSFENSFCKDYITEKCRNPLKKFVVPIVMGSVNYTERTPPHSVINVLDFKSPKYLAKYLLRLDKNDTEYLEYFKWKMQYKVSGRSYNHAYCKLCSIINGKREFVSHTNYSQWWNPPGTCKNDMVYNLIKP